eukprot:gene2641-2680_t
MISGQADSNGSGMNLPIAIKTDYWFFDLLWLFLSMLAAAILVDGFRGEFPINDDWSFISTLQRFLDTGDFRPTGWAAMPMLTNIAIGWVAVKMGGMSIAVLRTSSFIASLVTAASVYLGARAIGGSRLTAVLAAATIAANPVHFVLSLSFMTDIAANALMMVSAILFSLSLRRPSLSLTAVATLVSVAAMLSRQLALSVPIAFFFTVIIGDWQHKRRWIAAALPALVVGMSFVVFSYLMQATGRTPHDFDIKNQILLENISSLNRFLKTFSFNAFVALQYIGLFCLPVSLIAAAAIAKADCRRFAVLTVAACAAIMMIWLVGYLRLGDQTLMPSTGNILVRSGIGPNTLRDTFVLRLPNRTELPLSFWAAVTAFSLFGAALLTAVGFHVVLRLFGDLRRGQSDVRLLQAVFYALAGLANIAPLLVAGFFDRYLLSTYCCFMLALIGSMPLQARVFPQQRIATWLAAVAALGFLSFSVAATHDYLAWNRARWLALAEMVGPLGIPPTQIDGGFEFNGSRFYDPEFRSREGCSWWWVQDCSYVVSFGPMPGYDEFGRYQYVSWLTGKSQILVSKRHGD